MRGWFTIFVVFVACVLLTRVLRWFGLERPESTIGLLAVGTMLFGIVVSTVADTATRSAQFSAVLTIEGPVTFRDFFSAANPNLLAASQAIALSAFAFLVGARPVVDAFHGRWLPMVFFVLLIVGFFALGFASDWLARASGFFSGGPVPVVAFGVALTGLSYLLERLVGGPDIGIVWYSIRLLTMLVLGFVVWVTLSVASPGHVLLLWTQRINRSRGRILRLDPSLGNPLSLVEASCLQEISKYWHTSFALAPLIYAASDFLPAALLFLALACGAIAPAFIGCVNALAGYPKSAYLQLPRFLLPYAVLVVVMVNAALIAGYAAGYGLKVLLSHWFGNYGSLYLPDTLYFFFDRSPLALPFWGQAEGAAIAIAVVLCVAWLVTVWKKRAVGQFAGVALIAFGGVASKQLFDPVKDVLMDFGGRLTVTPAYLFALMVPAVAALVFTSIGHTVRGSQKCPSPTCNEDELPDHARFCTSCGTRLSEEPEPSGATGPA
jgi:hypothetical protein